MGRPYSTDTDLLVIEAFLTHLLLGKPAFPRPYTPIRPTVPIGEDLTTLLLPHRGDA